MVSRELRQRGRSAIRRGKRHQGRLILAGALLLLASACVPGREPDTHRAAPAACSWFGSVKDDTLYFGISRFWARYRAATPPRAPLHAGSGSARIGRFDLATETPESPLEVPGEGEVWDVLALGSRIYFARFFGSPGWVSRSGHGGAVWKHLGTGTSELAAGPGETLLFADYAHSRLLSVGRDGENPKVFPLTGPGTLQIAPKSVAYDPVRREIWVIADRLGSEGEAKTRDALVLDETGELLRHITDREVQFATFAEDGVGAIVDVASEALWLRFREAGETAFRDILLDARFPRTVDFAQDIVLTRSGGAVDGIVQRWSGIYHRFGSRGAVETGHLGDGRGGLFYTGVPVGDRVCATLCRDATVIRCVGPPR